MRVLGLDVATSPVEIRARIGYMPENDGHIPGLTAVQFVTYCGELAGLPRADATQRAHEVLYYVGLGEARYRNVETYSTGMKQRIKLAQALVHDPDLLFLDEPTNGMDPKGRDEMLELIRDLAHNKGVNLILSSHLLPDVEYTCEHVVVMDKGRIAASGPIDALKQPRGRVYELRVKTHGDLETFFDRLRPRVSSATRPTTTSCGCSCLATAARSSSSRWRRPRACRCGICGRAWRRSRTSSRTRWARTDADSRSGLPALRRREGARPCVARHLHGRFLRDVPATASGSC